MKRVLILAMILLSTQVNAQWKKIADFNGEYITCVYFLDLPGPPRIGFVGTGTALYKTTNGGGTWTGVWSKGNYALYFVTDICFKDSLTGWFSIYGDTDACYRTTDGGNSWQEVYGVPEGGAAVYYSQITNRLFLSLEDDVNIGMIASTDLGTSWQTVTDSGTGGFAFSTDSIGIVPASPPYSDTGSVPDTNFGIMRTTNGGLTWNYVPIIGPLDTMGFFQPLAIPGTSICFAATQTRITIWRSDDYGTTWKELHDFGPYQDSNFNEIGPYGTGYIKGDLSRLYIQTDDSGMYVSTDSGVAWRRDGGPSYLTNFSNDEFYSAKGVTMAGNTYNGGGFEVDDGLWEEDTAQAGVTEVDTSSSALRVFPNPTTDELQILGGQAGTIHILDIMGRERMNANNDGTSTTLDVSSLEPGTYFLRIGNQSAKVEIAR